MTDPATTAAYDAYAERWAAKIRSGTNIAHEYLEKPAMYGKLPDLQGKSVLCIGCGTGEECEHLLSLGAHDVMGTDISEGLISQAQRTFPHIPFQVMDMESLDLPPASFDFVYASLVMHYVDSWEKTLAAVSRVLKPGGTFLFSTHHPAVWGAARIRTETERSSLLGYTKFPETQTCAVIGNYLETRKIDDVWFGDLHVSYFHRPMEALIKDILASDLVLTGYEEPRAIDACKDVDPVFWEIRQKIPLFSIFELKKPK